MWGYWKIVKQFESPLAYLRGRNLELAANSEKIRAGWEEFFNDLHLATG
jgi:hypothetical protein